MNKVVIKYIGNGLYKDAKGDLWDRHNNAVENRTIRDYDGSEAEFRKERPDLAFMVDYGQMQMHIIEDDKADAKVEGSKKEEEKTPEPPKVEEPKTEDKVEEPKTEVKAPTKVVVSANK